MMDAMVEITQKHMLTSEQMVKRLRLITPMLVLNKSANIAHLKQLPPLKVSVEYTQPLSVHTG
jgi:hypothetical protein